MEYNNELILFCKSYRGDINRVKILHESILKYNKSNLPFYICIPKSDLSIFQSNIDTTKCNIIFDEDLTTLTSVQSHFTQQLFKMELYKTKIAKYYFTMDSDMYFIKPFYATDFVTEEGVPYFTIHECKDLLEYSECITGDGRLRDWFSGERIKIMNLFGRKGKLYDYSGSAILYIAPIFEDLYENYCKTNNLTFIDLLQYCSSENTWFGEYILYKGIKYMPSNPMFKTFHYKWQYDLAKQLGITEEILANNYLGITMQSNWDAPLKF